MFWKTNLQCIITISDAFEEQIYSNDYIDKFSHSNRTKSRKEDLLTYKRVDKLLKEREKAQELQKVYKL